MRVFMATCLCLLCCAKFVWRTALFFPSFSCLKGERKRGLAETSRLWACVPLRLTCTDSRCDGIIERQAHLVNNYFQECVWDSKQLNTKYHQYHWCFRSAKSRGIIQYLIVWEINNNWMLGFVFFLTIYTFFQQIISMLHIPDKIN